MEAKARCVRNILFIDIKYRERKARDSIVASNLCIFTLAIAPYLPADCKIKASKYTSLSRRVVYLTYSFFIKRDYTRCILNLQNSCKAISIFGSVTTFM
jgi:hypothetical protein